MNYSSRCLYVSVYQMERDAGLNIDIFECNNRVFYQSTYIDVTVIRTNDYFYNGISAFGQINRFKWWKDYYELVKQYGKYDPETNEVTPNFDLLHKSSTDKSPPNLENIIPD